MPAEADEGRAKKMTKQRTLDLIKSLEPDDDERTGISKKISWILRHGSDKVNIDMDPDGWVKVSDLRKTEILEDVPEETLMSTMVDKNAQKLRYKLIEKEGAWFVKAYSKEERKATTSLTGEPEKKSPGGLRQDAPTFVPSNFYSPAAGLQLGYPWGFGFSPMGPQWPGAYPMAPFMMEGAGASQTRYRGRIKSFNLEKGFGFIECAETYAQFSRDVFLHKAQYGDMTVGTEVTFLVETNKQGMPQAKDLLPLGASSVGKAGKGKGKGARSGRGGRGGAAVGGGRGGGRGGKGRGAGAEGNSEADAGAEAAEESGAQAPAKEEEAEAKAQATEGAGEAEAPAASTAAPQAAAQPDPGPGQAGSEQPGEAGAAEAASK